MKVKCNVPFTAVSGVEQSPIKESCANPVHGRHLVSSFASLGTSYRLRDELEQLPEKQYVYVT